MADTPWLGNVDDKLYLTSGQFSATIKTSLSVGAVDINPSGISWDGANTPWCGFGDSKLYLTSGQFTSTIKTSLYIGGIGSFPSDCSWDGVNTPWCSWGAQKLYVQSGQFSSVVKTSLAVGAVDTEVEGISWDGANTPWSGLQAQKLYLQSGQFSSTLKTSLAVGSVDTQPRGISWDGANTPWIGATDDKLYLTSGQFTSTLKTSQAVGGVETGPNSIETNDVNARLGLADFMYAGALLITLVPQSASLILPDFPYTGDLVLSLTPEGGVVTETGKFGDIQFLEILPDPGGPGRKVFYFTETPAGLSFTREHARPVSPRRTQSGALVAQTIRYNKKNITITWSVYAIDIHTYLEALFESAVSATLKLWYEDSDFVLQTEFDKVVRLINYTDDVDRVSNTRSLTATFWEV